MKKPTRWMGGALLAAALACTVGEGPADPAPPPGDRPDTVMPDVVEPPLPGAEAEARATELLRSAQLEYEAARVEAAYDSARRVLAEHPGTSAEAGAQWVAARAAFALGLHGEARELAESYAGTLPRGASQAEEARALAELARDALEPPGGAPAVIGAVLPRTGSRVLVRYGDWVLEGIRLAIQQEESRQGRRIELVVADDGGGTRTRDAVAELERRGALTIIGPLLPQQLAEAVGARVNPALVVVSPTIPEHPLHWPDAYAINTGDTRGAQELGRWAAQAGLGQAALLYSRTDEHERKAQAFAVEFELLGGVVRTAVPYDSGTTTFAPHMQRILEAVAPAPPVPAPDYFYPFPPDTGRALTDSAYAPLPQEPFALFVAAPDRDVRQIAPQVAFYGLDSAGVQLLGDEAWASAMVRRVVPARDLEGVIAASHFPPGGTETLADPEFVRVYEQTYRKSLENVVPALGYDATNLVLQALPNRMLTPGALSRRFRLLAGIRGATGLLSVRANRVVRTPFLVVIEGGQLQPAPEPWGYRLPVPRPAAPDTLAGGGRR